MRLATYNVEWFANLFDDEDQLLADGGWSGRHDVTRQDQAEAIAVVLTAIDADAVMIIEAPNSGRRQSTVRALENFAKTYGLRQHSAVMGFANETQQEIALLYDPYKLDAWHDPRGDFAAPRDGDEPPRFDGVFHIDLDIDATEDHVRFSKPPLELMIRTTSGTEFRMIGAHLKSKAPYGARGHDAIMRAQISNRRKQLAQAIWLRARLQRHLDAGEPVILAGDLNDGPGLDEFEHLFGRSSVEILLGDDMYDPHARMALQQRIGATPVSARFWLPTKQRYLQALLDYIMVSPDLMARAPAWRIWHPFDDQRCYAVPELREALLTASDHFPITLDIDL